MDVFIILDAELGWDNIVCVADSLEAAASYCEISVKELENHERYVTVVREIQKVNNE